MGLALSCVRDSEEEGGGRRTALGPQPSLVSILFWPQGGRSKIQTPAFILLERQILLNCIGSSYGEPSSALWELAI